MREITVNISFIDSNFFGKAVQREAAPVHRGAQPIHGLFWRDILVGDLAQLLGDYVWLSVGLTTSSACEKNISEQVTLSAIFRKSNPERFLTLCFDAELLSHLLFSQLSALVAN